jgi:hypothetical protein
MSSTVRLNLKVRQPYQSRVTFCLHWSWPKSKQSNHILTSERYFVKIMVEALSAQVLLKAIPQHLKWKSGKS